MYSHHTEVLLYQRHFTALAMKAMVKMSLGSRKVMKRPVMKFPAKQRNKQRLQRPTRSDHLEAARRGRAAWRAKRNRLEATGTLYTPKAQVVPKLRRGRSSLSDQYTFDQLINMSTKKAYKTLVDNGFLPEAKGASCPECKKKLSSVEFRGEDWHPDQRCQHKGCSLTRKKVTAGTWADHQVPLAKLSALAYLSCGALTGSFGQDDAALLTGVSHEVCAQVMKALGDVIHKCNTKEQAAIKLEGQCEVDASTLRTVRLCNGRIKHIRVLGMSKRGDHTKTIVYMLPAYSSPPGGATRPENIQETERLLRLHTGKDILIWHSDGARCYRNLKHHTSVKHKRKQWVAVRQLKLANGDTLCCYGGTELQDGLWKHVKHHIPKTMNTASPQSEQNIGKRVSFWAWRYRRAHQLDMFAELGASVASMR